MHFHVITVLPQLFEALTAGGVIARALQHGLIHLTIHDLRQAGIGRHRQVDDYPFGGGSGMILMLPPLLAVLRSLAEGQAGSRPFPLQGREWGKRETAVILLTPAGRLFNATLAQELGEFQQLALVCGRYSGVDDRIRHFVDEEVSIGDYILTGGEIPALALIDAVARYVPGVVGHAGSVVSDSPAQGYLEHPQFTRPAEVGGLAVPEVLLSGNHQAIQRWRLKEALRRTLVTRPDLLREETLTPQERETLAEVRQELAASPGTGRR